ncbi:hypothetical protein KKH38_01575 [Patescibacteria group bacterium]|nr:hypothetical protein [Patescibacteria group bacterium]MBU4600707.1 hypothetical protein [Patescibacteria group bacterium]MCG2698482.1 hypothetical protein [Candidatus Parcubacteria bacterium]
MSIEKQQHFKNDQGQINDPEIAAKMAEEEDLLRKDDCTQEDINRVHDTWGKRLYAEKMMPAVTEKINNILTEGEKEVIKTSTVLFGRSLLELIKKK